MLLAQNIPSPSQAAGNFALLATAQAPSQSGSAGQESGPAEAARSGVNSFLGAFLLTGAVDQPKAPIPTGLLATAVSQVVPTAAALRDVEANLPTTAEASKKVAPLSGTIVPAVVLPSDTSIPGDVLVGGDTATMQADSAVPVNVSPVLPAGDSTPKDENAFTEASSSSCKTPAANTEPTRAHDKAKAKSFIDRDVPAPASAQQSATDYLRVVAALDARSTMVTPNVVPMPPKTEDASKAAPDPRAELNGPRSVRSAGYSAIVVTAAPVSVVTVEADVIDACAFLKQMKETSPLLAQDDVVPQASSAESTHSASQSQPLSAPDPLGKETLVPDRVDSAARQTPLQAATLRQSGLPNPGIGAASSGERVTVATETATLAVNVPDAAAKTVVAGDGAAEPAVQNEDPTPATSLPQVQHSAIAGKLPQVAQVATTASSAPGSTVRDAESPKVPRGKVQITAAPVGKPQTAKKADEARATEVPTQPVRTEVQGHAAAASIATAAGSPGAGEKSTLTGLSVASGAAQVKHMSGVGSPSATTAVLPVEAKGNHLEFAVQDASMGAIRIHASVGSAGELNVNVAASSEQARAELSEIAPLLHASVMQHVEAQGGVASLHLSSTDTSTSTMSQPDQRQQAAGSFTGTAAGGNQPQGSASRQQRPATTPYLEQRRQTEIGSPSVIGTAATAGAAPYRGALSVRI